MTESALVKGGYTVLTAASGAEALEVARRRTEPIRLLLTDVLMPGLDGRDLAKQVRAAHPETSVLYISGYNEAFVQLRGGPDDGGAFLEKPFTSDILLRKVSDVLESGRMSRPAGSS